MTPQRRFRLDTPIRFSRQDGRKGEIQDSPPLADKLIGDDAKKQAGEMKIPADARSPYLSESDSKAIADGQRAEPVEGPARIRTTLPHTGSERGRGHERGGRAASESAPRSRLPGQMQTNPDSPVGEERRKEERRKKDIPVMLDTRLTRRRRTGSGDQPINFRI